MEMNNGNDYTRETSDYEPNFILREPKPDEAQIPSGEVRKAIDPLKESPDESGRKVDATIIDKADASDEGRPINARTAPVSTEPSEKIIEPVTDTDASEKIEPETDTDASGKIESVESFLDKKSDDHGIAQNTGASGPQARPTQVMRPIDKELIESSRTALNTTGSAGVNLAGTGGADTSDMDTNTGGTGTSFPYQRPRFENPSFDDGSRYDSFVDPRDRFRKGESASWENGQVRTDTKAKKKKAPKTVTMTRKMLALLIAGCLFMSALFGFGGVILGSSLINDNNTSSSGSSSGSSTGSAVTANTDSETQGYTLESSTGSNMTVKEITVAAKDSVVEIRTEGVVSDSWMQEYVTEGAGSGVIISEDGYIMTNNHVISDASKIKVTTSDEKEYDATLVGADETSDVAIIKIDASGLKAAKYGNSDELEVGDLAVAIGNPLGELGGTVTAGIISATDRALSIDGKTLHLLQTDSSINPGNSGGGLFNDDGQMIGLVVAKSSGSDVEGLGFAIPINTAANVAQQLMDKGYVSGQPSTGMTYQEGTSGSGAFGDFNSLFGGSSQKQVYIYSVNGKNAQKAGFKSGDIVLSVDGEEITSFEDLSAIVTGHKVGDELEFIVSRNGNEEKINLVLEEKTQSNNSSQSTEGGSDEGGNDSGNGGAEDNNTPQTPGGEEFSPFPEDEGGSFFDFFF